jgi:hypothetical protein
MSKTQRLRDQLYLLQGSRCFYCDKAIPLDDRSLEHVIPSCAGGLANSENAVVVCEAANQLLGSATPKQKMIMLKAGSGKIECPKKCVGGQTGTYGDLVSVSPQPPPFRATTPHAKQQGTPQPRGNSFTQEYVEQSNKIDDTGKTPMTAKQKNKARSGHQSMPRPAAGRRR